MHDHSSDRDSRRRFLRLAAGTASVAAVAGVTGLFPRAAQAADLPALKEDDPTAKALQYVEDAGKAGAERKAGDSCANCQFYHGKDGDGRGPCDLFPGKSVNANGWCVSHATKS